MEETTSNQEKRKTMKAERIFYLVKCPRCREVKVTSARKVLCLSCGHRFDSNKKLAEKQELKLGGI